MTYETYIGKKRIDEVTAAQRAGLTEKFVGAFGGRIKNIKENGYEIKKQSQNKRRN